MRAVACLAALGGLVGSWAAAEAQTRSGDWCPTLGPGYREPARTAKGIASWYGARFAGRRTASGEPFDPRALTAAAHRTWPLGTRVRVTDLRSGRRVVVRINDRLGHRDRVIDLSRAAAAELGLVRRGLGRVLVEEIEE